jgi:hypothetical protein
MHNGALYIGTDEYINLIFEVILFKEVANTRTTFLIFFINLYILPQPIYHNAITNNYASEKKTCEPFKAFVSTDPPIQKMGIPDIGSNARRSAYGYCLSMAAKNNYR